MVLSAEILKHCSGTLGYLSDFAPNYFLPSIQTLSNSIVFADLESLTKFYFLMDISYFGVNFILVNVEIRKSDSNPEELFN